MQSLDILLYLEYKIAKKAFSSITHPELPSHIKDICLVEHQDNQQVKIHQHTSLTAASTISSGFWGLLVGSIFLMPIAGLMIGTATGALAGKLSDIGLDDDFIRQVGDHIEPKTAAVIILSSAPFKPSQIHHLPTPQKTFSTHFDLSHKQRIQEALQS